MTMGLATAIRNTIVQAIRDAIDAGAGAGKLRVYDGARPATGGAPTNLLAELTFSDPSAPGAAGGVLTFSAITEDSSADLTGTATWCRLVDSTGAFVADASVTVTGGGGDFQLVTVSIVAATAVQCTSATITAGNP